MQTQVSKVGSRKSTPTPYASEVLDLGGMAAALYTSTASVLDLKMASAVAEIEDLASESIEYFGIERFYGRSVVLEDNHVFEDRWNAALGAAECWRRHLEASERQFLMGAGPIGDGGVDLGGFESGDDRGRGAAMAALAEFLR